MHTVAQHSRPALLVSLVVIAAALALPLGVAATTGTDRRGGITTETPLDYDRLGPIRIGMTLVEARRVSGQRLPYEDSIANPGCGWADLQPKSLGAALGVANGVVEWIQLRRSAIRVVGGGRMGDSLRTLQRRYRERLRRGHPNPYVRTLTRGTHRIVFSVYERHPVDVITAGRRPWIEHGNLCT